MNTALDPLPCARVVPQAAKVAELSLRPFVKRALREK